MSEAARTQSPPLYARNAPSINALVCAVLVRMGPSTVTRRSAEFALKLFVRWCAEQRIAVADLRAAHVRRFLRDLAAADIPAASVAASVDAMRHFCKQPLVRRLLGAPRRVLGSEDRDVVLVEGVEMLQITAIEQPTLREIRDTAILTLMTEGCAVRQLLELRVGDFVRLGSRYRLRVRGEGGALELQHCSERATEAVRCWLDASDLTAAPGHLLFPRVDDDLVFEQTPGEGVIWLALFDRTRVLGLDGEEVVEIANPLQQASAPGVVVDFAQARQWRDARGKFRMI